MRDDRPTHLIGRHLQAELPGLKPFSGVCAVCACTCEDSAPGWPLERVVTDTFADGDWLTGGGWICELCLRCLGQGQPRSAWIKNWSCLATPSELRILTRDDLWSVLTAPPAAEPFVVCVSFDHKKHTSFKARANAPGSPYWVRTDRDTARVDLDAMAPALWVLQAWYSVCRDTAAAPTWFTKEDCLRGCRDARRVAQYGVDRYRAEDRVLAAWRGDHALDVLVYALNKRPFAAEEAR